jgi:uncharacterized membrane protein YphA (DoxX/SURF4 family)
MSIINILQKQKWAIFFVIYLRYLIGASFVFASIIKIQGKRFTTDNGIEQPINSAWHLFETLYQSGIYWQFIGWGQLIAGLLLMTQRFATIGALIFFFIAINIFFITISYPFGGTPIITGLILFANIFLLLWDYKKLIPLFRLHTNKPILSDSDNCEKFAANIFWTYLGFLLFATTIIYVIICDRNPILWFFICVTLGIIGLIFYKIKLRNR